MGNKSTTAASRARRWATYAACAWCVAFGALHAWWALGIPFGFPGGEASYQVMANSPWRMVVDVIVVVMSVLGFLVVRALMQPAVRAVGRWWREPWRGRRSRCSLCAERLGSWLTG
jgi:cytochrome bd-type quinol oxidase subunit 2